MGLHVHCQHVLGGEILRANGTLVRPLPGVRVHVHLQETLRYVLLLTELTGPQLGGRDVVFPMDTQRSHRVELGSADVAIKIPSTVVGRVLIHVLVVRRTAAKHRIAPLAHEYLLTVLYLQVVGDALHVVPIHLALGTAGRTIVYVFYLKKGLQNGKK